MTGGRRIDRQQVPSPPPGKLAGSRTHGDSGQGRRHRREPEGPVGNALAQERPDRDLDRAASVLIAVALRLVKRGERR